jgi:lincosamide nucleotidyltransferase B/F
MLQQEAMIERTRRVCREDERLAAAMMYGSFAQGEGDGFSDIEFILFFRDEELEGLDQEEWVSRISPVELYFVNEYGNGTAIFQNLVRGEFHFDRASDIERVVGESMRDADWLPSLEDTLILDRTGELGPRLREIVGPPPERDTPGQIRFVCYCFVNWFVFGSNLFARGELARSLELLGIVRDRLLQMVCYRWSECWKSRRCTGSTPRSFWRRRYPRPPTPATRPAPPALTGTSFARLTSLPGSGGGS